MNFTVTVKYEGDPELTFVGCDAERRDKLIQDIDTSKIDFFKVTRESEDRGQLS